MTITRFAPSPTGYLHIGGLRTALYSYLLAKKMGGKFRLRIEDTDMERNSKEATKAIIEAFTWVGLSIDEKIEYQSERLEIYQSYIDLLIQNGSAYYCYMSKEELDELRLEQKNKGLTPRYDGRYRDFKGIPPKGIAPVVRIKVLKSGFVEFVDGVKGRIKFNANEIDDFVIARSNKIPTYNFVVAVDDHLMGITDVIRGDDHLTNTPKQILIYKALQMTIPNFYHIPMINNPEGKKLSKRDGAADVMDYKRLGYLPNALLNFLVRLGWSHGDQEIFSLDEMINFFNPTKINSSASSYSQEKLDWLNAVYIKRMSANEILSALREIDFELEPTVRNLKLLDILKNRAKTLRDIEREAKMILERPIAYDENGIKKFITSQTKEILQNYIKFINSLHINNAAEYEMHSKIFLEKNKVKMPDLFQPLRISLTGSTDAPSIYDLMEILGKKETILRIQTAIKTILVGQS